MYFMELYLNNRHDCLRQVNRAEGDGKKKKVEQEVGGLALQSVNGQSVWSRELGLLASFQWG